MKSAAEMHWDYFLVLEDELIEVFKFIEPCADNFRAYGPKIAKLFVSVCSEIDASFRDLAKIIAPGSPAVAKKNETIADFRRVVQQEVEIEFDRVCVEFGGTECAVEPWNAWWSGGGGGRVPSGNNPDWWVAYNAVKHDRAANYAQANLGNLIEAFAGLMVVCASLARHTDTAYPLRSTRIVEFENPRFGSNASSRIEGNTLVLGGLPSFQASSFSDGLGERDCLSTEAP